MLDRNRLNLTPVHKSGANPDECSRCIFVRMKLMKFFKPVVFVVAALFVLAVLFIVISRPGV